MNHPAQYRVDIPKDANIEQMRAWCKKHLTSVVKLTFRRKYDKQKKKWVPDYKSGAMFRFREEGDALYFKLMWTEEDNG